MTGEKSGSDASGRSTAKHRPEACVMGEAVVVAWRIASEARSLRGRVGERAGGNKGNEWANAVRMPE